MVEILTVYKNVGPMITETLFKGKTSIWPHKLLIANSIQKNLVTKKTNQKSKFNWILF